MDRTYKFDEFILKILKQQINDIEKAKNLTK